MTNQKSFFDKKYWKYIHCADAILTCKQLCVWDRARVRRERLRTEYLVSWAKIVHGMIYSCCCQQSRYCEDLALMYVWQKNFDLARHYARLAVQSFFQVPSVLAGVFLGDMFYGSWCTCWLCICIYVSSW